MVSIWLEIRHWRFLPLNFQVEEMWFLNKNVLSKPRPLIPISAVSGSWDTIPVWVLKAGLSTPTLEQDVCTPAQLSKTHKPQIESKVPMNSDPRKNSSFPHPTLLPEERRSAPAPNTFLWISTPRNDLCTNFTACAEWQSRTQKRIIFPKSCQALGSKPLRETQQLNFSYREITPHILLS